MTWWRKVLQTALVDGSWTSAGAVDRPGGLDGVSVQAKISASSWEGATVTLVLQGTLVHPGAEDDAWETLTNGTVTATDDGYAWFGGSHRLVFAGAYRWLRVKASHADGTPADGAATVYLDGDLP